MRVGGLGFLNGGFKKHWKEAEDGVLCGQRDGPDNPDKCFSFLIHLIRCFQI